MTGNITSVREGSKDVCYLGRNLIMRVQRFLERRFVFDTTGFDLTWLSCRKQLQISLLHPLLLPFAFEKHII